MPLLNFSPVVAGVWRMASWEWSVAERVRWIEQCLEAGVTTFDHADIYGGYTVEGLFGEALAAAPELKARVKLVTKCGIHLLSPSRPDTWIKHYDSSGRHIAASVERSLKNLGVEQLDLLLLHRPDSLMEVDEVAQVFDALRAAGKVAAFGVSNFTPSQFALLYSQTPLVTNQIEWHPLHLAPLFDGTLDQAQQLRLRPMIWSPLAGGALFSSDSDAAHRVRRALGRIAGERAVSEATVAYAWLGRHPSKPVAITGTRRIDAIREAVAATELVLSRQEWTEILVAGTGKDVP